MSFTYFDCLSDRQIELLKESEFLGSPFGEREPDGDVRMREVSAQLQRISDALTAPSHVRGRSVQSGQNLETVITECIEAAKSS